MKFLEEQQHLIADELNVKKVVLGSDETQFVSLKAKPNFRVLGKKVGKLMKSAQSAIDAFDHEKLSTLLNGGTVELSLEGESITLTPEDVAVERQVRLGLIAANQGTMTIALDTALTDELLLEGLAREVVNKINTMRREAGFEVTDRIHLKIESTDRLKACFDKYGPMINGEVLALSVEFGPCEGTAWDLNGELAKIALVRN